MPTLNDALQEALTRNFFPNFFKVLAPTLIAIFIFSIIRVVVSRALRSSPTLRRVMDAVILLLFLVFSALIVIPATTAMIQTITF